MRALVGVGVWIVIAIAWAAPEGPPAPTVRYRNDMLSVMRTGPSWWRC